MRAESPGTEEPETNAGEAGNKLINEEYKIWKANAKYLYDVVITHSLDWPSLSCQWFPDRDTPANKAFIGHRILLGTHTSGQARDFLHIADLQLPNRETPVIKQDYDDEKGEIGSHSVGPRLAVSQSINHAGEVNRARYMPQNPNLIATKSVSGNVLVFDRTKHSSRPDKDGVCKPDITLIGQAKEGFGLSWSTRKEGHILSSSEDTTVCHWDISSYSKKESHLAPVGIYRGHESVVGDVSWHHFQENIFASVGDDRQLMIWDTRAASYTKPQHRVESHFKEVLSVAFSPASEHLLITGSGDRSIILTDLRAPEKKLHTFFGHQDEVLQLEWSPHAPSVFASGSSDRRVHIWDIAQIGAEQTPDDAEDGAPELLFVHGGHTSRITDLGWAPNEKDKWHLVSTAEDNVIMIWSPTWRIWAGSEVPVEESELERAP